MITIDLIKKRTAAPLYEQLYYALRGHIELGTLAADERLPSKRKLALHMKISLNTVENAYAQLDAEGYLYTIPRRGYFVSRLEPIPEITAGKKSAHTKAVPASESPASTYSIPSKSERKKSHSETSSRIDHPEANIIYDMRIAAVDRAHFPYSVWNRMQRRSIEVGGAPLLDRSDPMGNPALRREIARYLESFKGMRADPDNIVLGAGMEYLFGVLTDMLRGRRFAVENPGNPSFHRMLRVKGCECTPIGLDDEGIDFGKLCASYADAAVVMPAHHFPSGIIMSVNRKRQLRGWLAQRADRILIEDDFDSEFRHTLRPISTLYGMEQGANIVYMNSFTRTIAPSLRIAYMILPEKLRDRYLENTRFFSGTVSEFEQLALERFIAEGYFERHVMRMRKVYKRRRDEFAAALADLNATKGFEVTAPKCGLTFIIHSSEMTEQEMLNTCAKKGIKLYPASEYYFQGKQPKGTILAGFAGQKTSELKEAAKKITTALTT